MWQTTPAARKVPSDGPWAARRGGGLSPATTFPSSNGQDRGPSSRVCRFKSGREYQRGCSSVDRAIALQAKDAGLIPAFSTKFKLAVAQTGQRASFGTRRPQVRILPARPFNTSVAQRNQSARLRTARPRVPILPEVPAEGAVTQQTECLLVEQEVAGSSPAGAANDVPRGFLRGGP
jgi:hypothetical protein